MLTVVNVSASSLLRPLTWTKTPTSSKTMSAPSNVVSVSPCTKNDGSYLAHTQGRKHQTNLARRAAREQKEGRAGTDPITGLPVGMVGAQVSVRKNMVKIGRPGYKITKTRDPVTRQQGLLFQLQYPEIVSDVQPRIRFMSAYEQKVEDPDKDFNICWWRLSHTRRVGSSCRRGRLIARMTGIGPGGIRI
ncbi:hypothetical protein DID88_001197 [Monilinia fructigena]|uniref:SF3A2 domain-containing protein n=1 Tax=Monilinia fructigena TaxID=38457 RepID=A0A395IXS6_9HELO|nr:hypothetical protein DID88_001197 [Monilinia fructigena]